jgi:integrase
MICTLTYIDCRCSLELFDVATTSYIGRGRAPSTVRAYDDDWLHFAAWCHRHGLRALPAAPSTIVLYIRDMAGLWKASTIARRLVAISRGHAVENYESPCSVRHAAVAEVLADIKQSKVADRLSKDPLMTEDLRRIILSLPENTLGARDAAMLLLGFAGGFRRAELAFLNIEHVENIGNGGLMAHLKHCRVADRMVAIPFGACPEICPVQGYRHWIELSGITSGPVFRAVDRHGNIGNSAVTEQVLTLVVKRACKRVGLDPTLFGARSLRSGWRLSRETSGDCRSTEPDLDHRISAGVLRQ